MKRFYIETFGCQMNAHDSEKIAGSLAALGYARVDCPENADLVLYNTCSVREKAERKVYNRLAQFRRSGGGRLFGVLGCVAEQEGTRIFDRAPHVALVCGSASYGRFPELIAALERGERRVAGLGFEAAGAFETPHILRESPFKASVTIMEGCGRKCAYCVVPSVRGPERSRSSAAILEEVASAASSGGTEVLLLGQNVNSYRDPSAASLDFPSLLARVAAVAGLRRVRFATSHPCDFTRAIVEAMDANPALCGHIHLPVQSGSTSVLRRMRRGYSREDYLRCVEWIRSARRPIAISTDVIVGFPGETEEDFLETLRLLDEVRFETVFSFKYSPRPGTAALALDGQVPDEERGRRLTALQEKQRLIQLESNSRLIGSVQEALVEGYNPATGQWVGRTSQNRVLNFTHALPAPPPSAGSYWLVRVKRAGANSLTGESVNLV